MMACTCPKSTGPWRYWTRTDFIIILFFISIYAILNTLVTLLIFLLPLKKAYVSSLNVGISRSFLIIFFNQCNIFIFYHATAWLQASQFFFNTLKARANARNNTQHCWAQQCCFLLRDVSRCMQTLATSHNMLGL